MKESEKTNESLPFSEIGPYADNFTTETVITRLIEGLGFRYYWATDGLRDIDLSYKPSDDSRSSLDVLEHIYGLTEMVSYAFHNKEYPTETKYEMSFSEYRTKTLLNLKKMSDMLIKEVKISEVSVKINFGGQSMSFPFWNAINGPLSDAIWRTGQIASNRRASGNPFNSRAQVFLGKLM
ncbi:hypothetical protein [Polaribacter sp.]|jgi:hypothetical protein|uniref:hypothetical protein n=1 Tax=Polaribacter sp. TaxID=1920175 RepID=UPI004047E931